jgi:hypothetical protein
MRTVTFQSVLNGTAAKLGMDPLRDLNPARAASLTEYANLRLVEGWKFEFWPEWTVSEQRWYRDVYAATANVVAADQRLFLADGNYYQALQAQAPAAQAPATLTGGVYVENSAWWAQLQSSYAGADWATGTVFAVGNQTRNPADNRFYQCVTAHTAGVNFDATKFGVLTPFDRYVAYEQTGQTPMDEVKLVSRRDPRVWPDRYHPVAFAPSADGIQILDPTAPGVVWVTFRLRPPQFTSTLYSAGGNVAVNELRYWPSASGGTGEVYQALQAQTPAAQPPSNAAYWARVSFPAILANFVKRAAFADALSDQKQQDRKTNELETALDELVDASDRALAGQGQFDRATVQTYGG